MQTDEMVAELMPRLDALGAKFEAVTGYGFEQCVRVVAFEGWVMIAGAAIGAAVLIATNVFAWVASRNADGFDRGTVRGLVAVLGLLLGAVAFAVALDGVVRVTNPEGVVIRQMVGGLR